MVSNILRDGGVHVKIVFLVVGLVLLLVGLFGMLWGFLAATSAETAYTVLCPGGTMPPGFCAGLLSTAATYRTMVYIMGAIGVGGLALTVAGATMKEMRRPTMMPPPPPAPPPVPGAVRTCARCGRANAWDDRFCASCGVPFG